MYVCACVYLDETPAFIIAGFYALCASHYYKCVRSWEPPISQYHHRVRFLLAIRSVDSEKGKKESEGDELEERGTSLVKVALFGRVFGADYANISSHTSSACWISHFTPMHRHGQQTPITYLSSRLQVILELLLLLQMPSLEAEAFAQLLKQRTDHWKILGRLNLLIYIKGRNIFKLWQQ